MSDKSKLPVLSVTGFLGSGKTTFLRNLAESHPDWHMLFLVNEFADFSVDGTTLKATGTPTHSVVGGSLFCECKAGDFLRIMREEVLPRHQSRPLDAVVIETSGTADPDAIGKLMSQHGLDAHFELRSIISIVAPRRFLKLLENLPVTGAQIGASDLVVINKTDTAEATVIDVVESAIRIRNPDTGIIRAEYCQIEFLLPQQRATLPKGRLSTCEANAFGRFNPEHPDVSTHTVDGDAERIVQLSPGIWISEPDIAEILQAKAAIGAGVQVLLELAGMTPANLEKVYVAGGFGYHLNPDHAMRIGLLPTVPPERMDIIGNASLGGSSLALQADFSNTIQQLQSNCRVVELNQIASFSDHYTDALLLEEIE